MGTINSAGENKINFFAADPPSASAIIKTLVCLFLQQLSDCLFHTEYRMNRINDVPFKHSATTQTKESDFRWGLTGQCYILHAVWGDAQECSLKFPPRHSPAHKHLGLLPKHKQSLPAGRRLWFISGNLLKEDANILQINLLLVSCLWQEIICFGGFSTVLSAHSYPERKFSKNLFQRLLCICYTTTLLQAAGPLECNYSSIKSKIAL